MPTEAKDPLGALCTVVRGTRDTRVSTTPRGVLRPRGHERTDVRRPRKSNRVGLLVECPDMESFQSALQSEAAADATKYDGVRPETIVILTEP